MIREQRGANYMGFEVVEPDAGTRREPKVIRGNGELTLTSSEPRSRARLVGTRATSDFR